VLQDYKTPIVAAIKELIPLIVKPVPNQTEQITEDLSHIISRFRPFLSEKLETIYYGGEAYEDGYVPAKKYEEPGVPLTLGEKPKVYLLSSGVFLKVEDEPEKIDITSVSTPEVLTGVKWLVANHFLDFDEEEISTLHPLPKEFIQFIATAALTVSEGRIGHPYTARLILLKIGAEAVPVLGEVIVDKHLDNFKKEIIAGLLGEIQDRRGIAPLFQVLKDYFERETYYGTYSLLVRIVEALEKIAGKELSFPDENSRIAYYIGHFDLVRRPGVAVENVQEAIEHLLPYLDNDRVAKFLLNHIASEPYWSDLEQYIGSKFIERRDHRMVELLAKKMSRNGIHDSEYVTAFKRKERKMAATLLGDLGGEEAERILIDAILNDAEEVRQVVRDVLIKIGDSIMEPLAEGIDMKKNEWKRLDKQVYNQMMPSLDEAYEVLRTIDKRPRTFLDNILGRRKY
jgi:hypothetical protein